MLLNQDECKIYRRESVVNIDIYPKLSDYTMFDQLTSNCMVLYYLRSCHSFRVSCMKNHSSQKAQHRHSRSY